MMSHIRAPFISLTMTEKWRHLDDNKCEIGLNNYRFAYKTKFHFKQPYSKVFVLTDTRRTVTPPMA